MSNTRKTSKESLTSTPTSKLQSSETISAKLAKSQSFEAMTVHRSQLKNAPYNPRTIDKHARKKLKDKLQKVGLVETLVWNKRTGNLVGGHQRLSIIDELEGTKDYNLTVAAVDIDDPAEKSLNIFLNNSSAQGSYDLAALEAILKDESVDRDSLGFDPLDIELMFDGKDLSPTFDDEKDAAKATVVTLEQMRAGRKAYKEKQRKEDDAEHILVFVFDDRAECERFAAATGFPADQRYLDGRRLATLLDVDLTAPPAESPAQTTEAAPLPETVQAA